MIESVNTPKGTAITREYSYTAVFEPAEEGGYVVSFPAIPNLMTQGETLSEAREMAADCLQCYLESLEEDGQQIPWENPDKPVELVREKVTVQIKTA